MIKELTCEVVDVQDTHVILSNRDSIWWLGNKATFQIPKDERLQHARKGDYVTITLKERNQ